MSATPFRGTLIFVGGLAAVAVTSVARFAGAGAAATAAGAGTASDGTTSGSATSAPATTGAADGSSDEALPTTAPATGDSSASDPTATATATPTTDPASSSGTVTIVGSTVQTRFGPLQLSVTFDGSDITDVEALQYPSWHGESVRINQYAIPILTQEAVAADSAQIDAVSGATITSEAYQESLQAAIDQRG